MNRKHVECFHKGTDFTLSVLYALTESQRAWTKVTQDTIANCWLHMTFNEDIRMTSSQPDVTGMTAEEFSDFVTTDDEVITSEVPSDQDIVAEVKGSQADPVSESDEETIEEELALTLTDMEKFCAGMRHF